MREYLSCPQGKSEDALMEYVKTNCGNYYQPIMIHLYGNWIVCVYKCSSFGHIDYNQCTSAIVFESESDARHWCMVCRYALDDNGIPHKEIYDAPSKDEYAELEYNCMNYLHGLTPMDI